MQVLYSLYIIYTAYIIMQRRLLCELILQDACMTTTLPVAVPHDRYDTPSRQSGSGHSSYPIIVIMIPHSLNHQLMSEDEPPPLAHLMLGFPAVPYVDNVHYTHVRTPVHSCPVWASPHLLLIARASTFGVPQQVR